MKITDKQITHAIDNTVERFAGLVRECGDELREKVAGKNRQEIDVGQVVIYSALCTHTNYVDYRLGYETMSRAIRNVVQCDIKTEILDKMLILMADAAVDNDASSKF